MRVVLALDPSPIEFTEQNSGGPYPYLTEVGELRIGARAGEAVGIAATESSSLPVVLDNARRRVARIIGRPLRVWAYVYDDANALLFSGIVSSVEYKGDNCTLEIGA